MVFEQSSTGRGFMPAFVHAPKAISRAALFMSCAMAGLAVTSQAQAQGAPALMSTSASLSKLSFSLIDLDPNDGITPGMTINAAKGYLRAPSDASSPSAYFEGSFLPSSAVSKSDSLVSAAITPTGASAAIAFSMDQFLARAESYGSQYYDLMSFSGDLQLGAFAGVFVFDMDDESLPNSATFTLTPRTALVVSGQAQVSNTIDTAALRDWLSTTSYTKFELYDSSAASIDVLLLPKDQNLFETDLDGYAQAMPGMAFAMRTPAREFTMASNSVVSDTIGQTDEFSIRFDNASDADASMGLAFAVNTYTRPTVWLEKPVNAVPEPSTWPLMALGLLGMALARRRQG
jgi:PEP-CTERM motif